MKKKRKLILHVLVLITFATTLRFYSEGQENNNNHDLKILGLSEQIAEINYKKFRSDVTANFNSNIKTFKDLGDNDLKEIFEQEGLKYSSEFIKGVTTLKSLDGIESKSLDVGSQ